MAESHEQEYVTVTEAAELYGVSADTIRRRMKRGELEARKESTPQGYRWLIPKPAKGDTLPGAGVKAVATLDTRLIDSLQRELASRNREIERLTGLLEVQARALESALERPALAERVEAEAVPPVSSEPTPDAPTGFWSRLGHLLRGK